MSASWLSKTRVQFRKQTPFKQLIRLHLKAPLSTKKFRSLQGSM